MSSVTYGVREFCDGSGDFSLKNLDGKSSIISMAPSVTISSDIDIVEFVKHSIGYAFPIVLLVLIILFISIRKCIRCCNCCGAKKIKLSKKLGCIVDLLTIIISAGILAISIVAIIYSIRSSMSDAECSAAQTFNVAVYGSDSYSFGGMSTFESNLSTVGTTASSLSISDPFKLTSTNAVSGGAWSVSRDAIRGIITDVASISSSDAAVSTAYSNFVNGFSTEYVTVADMSLPGFLLVATNDISNFASSAASTLSDSVSMVNDAAHQLFEGNLQKIDNIKTIVMIVLSAIDILLVVLSIIFYIVKIKCNGGLNSIPDSKRGTRCGLCIFKGSYLVAMFLLLLISAPVMLLAYTLGGVCKEITPNVSTNPYKDVLPLLSNLDDPAVNVCFDLSRSNSDLMDSLFTSTYDLSVKYAVYAYHDYAAASLSGSYTVPSNSLWTDLDTAVQALPSSTEVDDIKTKVTNYVSTINGQYSNWFTTVSVATFKSDIDSDLTSYPGIGTIYSNLYSIYDKDTCRVIGLAFRDTVYELCTGSVASTMIAAVCWVVLGLLSFISYLIFSQMHKWSKKAKQDNNVQVAVVENGHVDNMQHNVVHYYNPAAHLPPVVLFSQTNTQPVVY